jgi:hypothetical protein
VSLDAFLDLLLRTGGFEVVPVHSPGPDDLTARTREALEVRHYSPRTVGTYLQWIDRFAASVAPQTLASTDDSEINAFLTRLAADGNVASSSS